MWHPCRSVSGRILAAACVVVFNLPLPGHASADDANAFVKLYFGSGCFWHVQHEFVKAEERFLGRSGVELTSFTGYAGGRNVNSRGNACYHDYAGLGHTEVVGLTIPENSVGSFAGVFWGLFVGTNRVDVMDIGPEYRAAIGLPGGKQSPLFEIIQASQKPGQRFNLETGSGNDRDTLGEALVWVYDSDAYPFYQAEIYHQFHDDFLPGGQYPQSYNALQGELQAASRIVPTGCPRSAATPSGGVFFAMPGICLCAAISMFLDF